MQIDMNRLADAYRKTTYVVYMGSDRLKLRVGEICDELDESLRQAGISDWAVLTASNPLSTILPESENIARNRTLGQILKGLGYSTSNSTSVADDQEWPDEHGFLIFGIGLEIARGLAREFAQAAILAGTVGQPVELVILADVC